MATVWIRGGTVVTLDAGRRIVAGDVLVRDGRIAAIGAGAEPAQGEAATSVDAGGAVVLPGFVQTHIHLCQTLFRGLADDLPLLDWLRRRIWPLEAALDEEALRAAARLGIAELLLGGTTTILDMGTVHHHQVVFEELEAMGLRALSGKAMMDQGEGVPSGLLETTRASLDESQALARRWRGAASGRLGYAYAPRFVLSCTRELLEAVAALSAADGDGIHTHASENPEECRVVRELCGADNVAYLDALGLRGPRTVLAHCVHVTDEERALMGRARTGVSHCPSSNLKLASGIADLVALRAAGVPISLGADGAACNNNLDALTEMRFAALLQKPRHGAASVSALEALLWGTQGGAGVLGLGDQLGSLEVGKRADLVVLGVRGPHAAQSPSGDLYGQIVYSARASDVRHVVVDGALRVRDGALVGFDHEAIVARALEVLPAVIRRAGLG